MISISLVIYIITMAFRTSRRGVFLSLYTFLGHTASYKHVEAPNIKQSRVEKVCILAQIRVAYLLKKVSKLLSH